MEQGKQAVDVQHEWFPWVPREGLLQVSGLVPEVITTGDSGTRVRAQYRRGLSMTLHRSLC